MLHFSFLLQMVCWMHFEKRDRQPVCNAVQQVLVHSDTG